MRRVPARCALAASLVLLLALPVVGQLTGHLDLGVIARRIPTTLTGEIKLDTPSEFTMLEFAVASKLDLTLRTGFIDPRVKAAVNTAGIEHCVLSSPFSVGDLLLREIQLDELAILPEIWFAVPFEYVTDVNNLPNSVIIPPGDPRFVSARATFSASVGGFDVEHLVMLEDVNFPSPSGSYEPLYYPQTASRMAVGSLTTVSWRASIGFSMSAQLGLSASAASKSVKGHSAKGSVTPDESFLRLSIGGIQLGSTSLLGVGVQDVVLGTSFSVSTDEDERFATTVTVSGAAWEGTTISTAITLGTTPASVTISSIRLGVRNGPFNLGIALDTLDITGLSASFGNSLNLGAISGSWALSASGIERGLTGLAMRLALAQGIFSTNTSITFSTRGEAFGFASWSSSLNFRFSPAVVSVQATFGRYGLTRAAVTTSMSF
jgi:hypothetical protein